MNEFNDGPPDQTKLTEATAQAASILGILKTAIATPEHERAAVVDSLLDHSPFRVCIDCGKEHQEETCPYCRRTFEKPHETLIGTGLP